MLQRLDLQLTSTGFASIGAQRAAEKAGCEVDYKIRCNIELILLLERLINSNFSYQDLAEVKSNWNFVGTESEFYVQSSIKLARN